MKNNDQMNTFPKTLQNSLLKEQQGAVAIKNENMPFMSLEPTRSLSSLQEMYSCLFPLKRFLQDLRMLKKVLTHCHIYKTADD